MDQFDFECVNTLFDKLSARIDDLEALVEDLRYASPTPALHEDDYDYYLEGEWDAL